MADLEHKLALMAYADGELDVEQTIRLLGVEGLCAEDRESVAVQERLRRACRDCMCQASGKAPPAPAELRACIEAALAAEGSGGDSGGWQRDQGGVLAVIGRWAPSAVAALFLLGSLAVWTLMLSPGGDERDVLLAGGVSGARLAGGSLVLPVSNGLNAFAAQHGACAKDSSKIMRQVVLPKEVMALPGALHEYFGDSFDQTLPMDLSVMGFRFEQAGNCTVAGEGSIHVLYKPVAGAGSPETGLSLWISPTAGPIAGELAEGVLYSASSGDGKPIFLWRASGLSYFLVGDQPVATRAAAAILCPGAGGVGGPGAAMPGKVMGSEGMMPQAMPEEAE
ncbi:MAG: hypothetical protein RIG82_03185 [Phycisphaeraceae bacterium]